MDVLIARTNEEIEYAYVRLSVASFIGCDTETSGLSARYGKLFSIQFSDGEFNVLVPTSEGVEPGHLTELLTNREITKIFHNARFDLDFLTARGIAVHNIFDTMIAEKVLTRGADQSSSLADTLYRYFAVDLDKSQRSKFNSKWNGVWTDALVNYALSDVVHLTHLRSAQIEWMTKLDLLGEFDVQMVKILGDQTTIGDKQDALP